MKMNYRFTRNVKAKRRSVWFWLPISFVGALVLFYFFYPAALGNLVSRVAFPFWNGRQIVKTALHEAFSFFAAKQRLSNEAAEARAELNRARALLLDRELLLEENRALREQFGRTTVHVERRLGIILVMPPQSLYDTAIVDIGSRDGVRVGDLALSGSAILGVVSKTFVHTSLVEFFSTAGKKTEVRILHEGRAIAAEAEGEGGGEFKVTLPKETSVLVGDQVVMPRESLLMFAAVEAIEGASTDSFQAIRFKNPVSIQSLRFLEIQSTEVKN